MKREDVVKTCLVAVLVVVLSSCCVLGGQLVDGPEIELKAVALWGGTTPPPGSSATVDFYVMSETMGMWNLIWEDVPYPEEGGVLVDTLRRDYDVPLDGGKVTYRYEMDLTVGGVTYTAEDYPVDLTCESGVWWWYFAGGLSCSESPR